MAVITSAAPDPAPLDPGLEPPVVPAAAPPRTGRLSGPIALAACASMGAGAIHAAAIGVHAEHRQAVLAFAALAFLQLGWGLVALASERRLLALVGASISWVALAGWILAKTSGIAFVDGLEEAESMQWPDVMAAALALVAMLLALRALLLPYGTTGRPHRVARTTFASLVAVVALVGMSVVGGHSHADGAHEEAGRGHSHGGQVAAGDDTAGDATTDTTHEHTAAAVAPKEYDPTKPIDLSGVEGVTPEQQAAAENLIAITLLRLPKFADYRTAEAEGFRSIRDGFTGAEHFINWSYIDDDHVLDPDRPESLVYDTTGGGRKLVSAMFMLPTGTTLDDVPELGGKLTQWHIHDNLCFGGSQDAPTVSGLTNADGSCSPPLKKFTPVPMIHVWITKHPCGPFAALEGVGAGQIKEGEERLCDHAHGASDAPTTDPRIDTGPATVETIVVPPRRGS